LKNRRFGESQIHRFRDHQEFQTVQKLWTASVCYERKYNPLVQCFFFEALLLFRFAFQQSGVFLAVATLLVFDGTRPSNHPHICTCDNVGVQSFTHAQTCDNVRVQSATQCTASVHTLHMPKSVI